LQVWTRRLLTGLFGYAVLTEILQATLPIQRDGDWHDVLADTVGTLLVLLLGARTRRVLRPRDRPADRSRPQG